jgi:hypothetical protein
VTKPIVASPYEAIKAKIQMDALISPDSIYRYTLTRTWDETKPKLLVLGLNPSTADEKKDDPTVRREIGFAIRWGYGALLKGNIFAFRATDPKKMKLASDPIGPDNNRWILEMAGRAKCIVAAWGVHGSFMNRDQAVAKLLAWKALWCLGVTKGGFPKHPLYVKAVTPLVPWLFKRR